VANAHSLPFLATSGHHGAIKTLAGVDCGVDINLRKLNMVELQEDGQTATIQGGILTKELTDALWKDDKWTGNYGPC
jgi:FAD/FMN-containing dehydrogenase